MLHLTGDSLIGIGDSVSFGLTKKIRDWTGLDTPCGISYDGGRWGGIIFSFSIPYSVLWRKPSKLYHFTDVNSAKLISKYGIKVGIKNFHGKGVYATRFNSKFMAKLQGAQNTSARIIVRSNKFKKTIVPGTFRTKNEAISIEDILKILY